MPSRHLLILLAFLPATSWCREWRGVSDMPTPVAAGQAVVHNDRIYILGGFASDSAQIATDLIQAYDPVANVWSTAGNMLTPRAGFVAALYGDTLVITGGVHAENIFLFSVELWSFSGRPSLYQSRIQFNRRFATGTVWGSKLYLFGGDPYFIATGAPGVPYLVEYDIPTSTITYEDSSFGVPPPYQQMSAFHNGKFYLFGGVYFNVSNRVYQFDPATRSLERIEPNMMMARAGGEAVEGDRNEILIMGGFNETSPALREVEVIRIAPEGTVTNRNMAPLNVARSDFMAVKYGDSIYVFGGTGDDGLLVPEVEVFSVITGVDEDPSPHPASFALHGNYPNPFNAGTIIEFDLDQPADVRVEIFSSTGQLVRTLMNSKLAPGRRRVQWNGEDEQQRPAPSGVYFCRLTAGERSISRKMLLVR